jgi:hypothetical protein
MRADASRGLDASAPSAWQAACRIIRDALEAAGIYPARAAALRLHGDGAEELEARGTLECCPP